MRTGRAISMGAVMCACAGGVGLWLTTHTSALRGPLPLDVWLRTDSVAASMAVLLLNIAALLAFILWVAAVGGAWQGRRWDWLVALALVPPIASALYPWVGPEATPVFPFSRA